MAKTNVFHEGLSLRAFFVLWLLILAVPSSHAQVCPGNLLGPSKLYNPASSIAAMGIQFVKTSQREIPILIYGEGFASYKVASIRTYETKDVITEVMVVENRIGVYPELIRRAMAENLWPLNPDGTAMGGDSATMTFEEGLKIKQAIMAKGYAIAHRIRAIMWQLEREGKDEWNKLIGDDVDFALLHYGRRRWGDGFGPKLQKIASQFAGNSTYIRAFKKNPDGTKGAQAGVFRLIRAPYGRRVVTDALTGAVISDEFGAWGSLVRRLALAPFEALRYKFDPATGYDERYEVESKKAKFSSRKSLNYYDLPLEAYLGQQVPREASIGKEQRAVIDGRPVVIRWIEGEVVEPGCFAIDKTVSGPVFMEIYIQMLAFAADPEFSLEFNRLNRAYFTYNDLPPLYSPMGFGVAKGKDRFLDNVHWERLDASGGDVLSALENLAQVRLRGDPERIEEVRRAFNQLMEREASRLAKSP